MKGVNFKESFDYEIELQSVFRIMYCSGIIKIIFTQTCAKFYLDVC